MYNETDYCWSYYTFFSAVPTLYHWKMDRGGRQLVPGARNHNTAQPEVVADVVLRWQFAVHTVLVQPLCCHLHVSHRATCATCSAVCQRATTFSSSIHFSSLLCLKQFRPWQGAGLGWAGATSGTTTDSSSSPAPRFLHPRTRRRGFLRPSNLITNPKPLGRGVGRCARCNRSCVYSVCAALAPSSRLRVCTRAGARQQNRLEPCVWIGIDCRAHKKSLSLL